MTEPLPAHLFISSLDIIGTFAFAVSGAMLGLKREMDLFGVLTLAFVTAVFGGLLRDLLIGAIPPAAISDWRYLAVALAAGLLTFWRHNLVSRLEQPVLFFDAVGLGVFAVTGTQKALDFGINWPMATVLGVLSGIGGGMIRDILAAQTPVVMRSEIYAVAALAGGLTVLAGAGLHLNPFVAGLTGLAVCVSLRLLALHRGWKLPSVRLPN